VSAPVRIEARAWGDIRFATLARLLCLGDPDYALIKVARLWSWQTEHFTAESPTYVLDADTIASVLGPHGPDALVRARLATRTDGGYRIHGTEGNIEWCEGLSSKRQRAGAKRARLAQRDERGRLMPAGIGKFENKSPAHAPAPDQHATSAPPAQSSAPSPSPSPEDQNSLSRAIPPYPVQAAVQAPERTLVQTPPPPPTREPRSSWHDRRRWWDAMLAADARLRADGIAIDRQTLPPSPAGIHEQNLAACARQLADAGFDAAEVDRRVLHVIAVAEAEARRSDARWFKPALIFEPERFARAVDTTLSEARQPRSGRSGDARERPVASAGSRPARPEFPAPAPRTSLSVAERLALAAEANAIVSSPEALAALAARDLTRHRKNPASQPPTHTPTDEEQDVHDATDET
jgi:hypothetical protein